MEDYVTEFIMEHEKPTKSKVHVGWCGEHTDRMYFSIFNEDEKIHTCFHFSPDEVDLLIRNLYGMLATKEII